MVHLIWSGTSRSPIGERASLSDFITVGFGEASVYRNGEKVYDERDLDTEGDYWTIGDAEQMYQKRPGHYIIQLFSPLHSQIIQRKSDGWETVYAGMGFADDENAEKDWYALEHFLVPPYKTAYKKARSEHSNFDQLEI